MKKKICSFTAQANFKKPVSSANDLLKWRVTEVRTALQRTKVLIKREIHCMKIKIHNQILKATWLKYYNNNYKKSQWIKVELNLNIKKEKCLFHHDSNRVQSSSGW